MKTVGIIGGIAPESTIAYYREIVNLFLEKSDGHYPPIIINSIDMTRMLNYFPEKNFEGLTNYLLDEISKLSKAGADFAILASNTPHIIFNDLKKKSSIPLVSIVEAACNKIKNIGLKRVGLFGTKFTMQSGFYKDVFEKENIEIVLPTQEEQDYIHTIYFNELVLGMFKNETKEKLLSIVDEMRRNKKIEGLVLGGTELPLILKSEDEKEIPFFDTTKIHVEEIMKLLLEK